MTYVYRGECEELYGREIDAPEHKCAEYITHKEHEWQETHGLDCGPYEHCYEEWWECAVCKAHYTETEVAAMIITQENGQ